MSPITFIETIEVCAHCGRDAETKKVCARCRGRGRVGRSEAGGDSSKGMGWANFWTEKCPDCGGRGA